MRKVWVLIILAVVGVGVTQIDSASVGSVTSVVKEDGDIAVHFCPTEDCETLLTEFLITAESGIDCAWFDVNLEGLLSTVKDLDVPFRLVIDENYAYKAKDLDVVVDTGYGLMHNKFCIIDSKKVSTGSMNPTERGTSKNNNHLLFFDSSTVASYYAVEFEELWNQEKNKKSAHSPLVLGESDVNIYFCPEDDCADKVVRLLRTAQDSIHFMTFSFTHTGIANAILLRMEDGVEVKGIYEKSQLNDYTTFDVLKEQGADVHIDGNKYNMHHKVFIVDGRCVVVGSMNPSKGGDSKNDENMLIICDDAIAGQFEGEFERVYAAAS